MLCVPFLSNYACLFVTIVTIVTVVTDTAGESQVGNRQESNGLLG